jgi:lambda repressor-like predicted transcriptional regulator
MNGIAWHTYAETFPVLEGEEYDAFKEDIRKRGQQEDIRYRMVNDRRQGLDGRNRERACLELGIVPLYCHVDVPDEKVEEWIDSRNLHRRHMTPEQRRDRVSRMRQRGMSTREIAEKVGVSKSTIDRDLQKPTEKREGLSHTGTVIAKNQAENSTSTNGVTTIRGRDGIVRPAKAAKPKKSGSVKFDDCQIEVLFTKLHGLLGRRKDRLGGDKQYEECASALNSFWTAFRRWQRETT